MPGLMRLGMVRRMHGGAVSDLPDPPGGITGLVGWWMADAGTSTTSDGVAVSQWDDQSGNNNHATQGTGANQPLFQSNEINGLPAIDFDGSSDRMPTPASAAVKPFSFFCVAKPTTIAANRAYIGASASGGIEIRIDPVSGGRIQLLKQGTTSIGSSNTALSAATTALFEVTYDGSGNAAFYRNGAAEGTASNNQTFSASNFVIGAGDPNGTGELWLGLIGEILVYNSALSTTDRETVEDYLMPKWGL